MFLLPICRGFVSYIKMDSFHKKRMTNLNNCSPYSFNALKENSARKSGKFKSASHSGTLAGVAPGVSCKCREPGITGVARTAMRIMFLFAMMSASLQWG
jgi:hypothetical protein